jgi:hypothetical protein
MDKPKLNFVIDAAMFLCLMTMAGLGSLMKYILPSGREGRHPGMGEGWNRRFSPNIRIGITLSFPRGLINKPPCRGKFSTRG